jgi:hypothetical protein
MPLQPNTAWKIARDERPRQTTMLTSTSRIWPWAVRVQGAAGDRNSSKDGIDGSVAAYYRGRATARPETTEGGRSVSRIRARRREMDEAAEGYGTKPLRWRRPRERRILIGPRLDRRATVGQLREGCFGNTLDPIGIPSPS